MARPFLPPIYPEGLLAALAESREQVMLCIYAGGKFAGWEVMHRVLLCMLEADSLFAGGEALCATLYAGW